MRKGAPLRVGNTLQNRLLVKYCDSWIIIRMWTSCFVICILYVSELLYKIFLYTRHIQRRLYQFWTVAMMICTISQCKNISLEWNWEMFFFFLFLLCFCKLLKLCFVSFLTFVNTDMIISWNCDLLIYREFIALFGFIFFIYNISIHSQTAWSRTWWEQCQMFI